MVQCESLTSFFQRTDRDRGTALFFPMDIPSPPISRAVWPYTPRIGHDLCQRVPGFLDIQDGKRPTQHGKRRLQYDTSP